MLSFADGPENPFPLPQDVGIPIWRYMSVKHFESLLSGKGLWFSRLDVMHADDPFEGSLPKPVYAQLQQQYDDTVMRASKLFGEISSNQRVMINCWHMSRYESVAMWRLYGRENKAICVQSAFNRLYTVLSPQRKIAVGVVTYIDYGREPFAHDHPFWSRFMHKRKSFEYEQELRAVLYNDIGNIPAVGLMVPVDLKTLLENIYVSPKADDRFTADVTDMVARAGFSVPVRRSSLDDAPLF